MDIKAIEEKMNDYILNMDACDEFIFENLPFFYELSYDVIKLLHNLFENYIDQTNIYKIDKSSFNDNLKLIMDFYKTLKVQFDANRVMNEGHIISKFFEYDDDNIDRLHFGANYYNDYYEQKEIIIGNNGLITDAIVLFHELSHYRNQKENNGRTPVSALFTEVLARTDELLFYKYVLEKGYKIDPNYIKYIFYHSYESAKQDMSIFELMMVYKDFSSISKKSYKLYYDTTKDYKNNLENYNDLSNDYSLMTTASYTFSILIAPYLFYKYIDEKNYTFLNGLNNMLLDEKVDASSCFKQIGLNELDDNDIKVLKKSMNRFKNEYLK